MILKIRIIFIILINELPELSTATEKNDVEIKKIYYEGNPKYVKDIKWSIKPVRNQPYKISWSFVVIKTINAFDIELQAYRKFNHYQPFPVGMKIDGCKALEGKKLNSLGNLVRDYLLKYASSNYSCPLNPGLIEIKDLIIDKRFNALIPSLFPYGLYKFDFQFYTKLSKFNSSRDMVIKGVLHLNNKDNF